MLKLIKSKKLPEHGQAVVEFALALLVFVPVVFVILDFGWISFQKVAFEYGYMHSSWDVTAADLGDYGVIDSATASAIYSGSTVADPLYNEIEKMSAAIDKDNLTIKDATATLYNKSVSFTVPSRISGSAAPAVSWTRYMDLSAEITYTIHPLTPFGDLIFESSIPIKKELKCTRIVATQHRSE